MGRRVLHVIPAVARRYGGPSAAVLGLCREQRRRGWRTLVATTDADGVSRLDVPLGCETTFEDLPFIFFPRDFSESFKWSRPLARWLDAHVADFDLVHVHAVFSHAVLAAGRACLRHDVPYLVRPLGTLDPWSVSRHRRRKQVMLACGLKRVLGGVSAMHYTSTEEHRLAETEYPWLPGGDVVPLGVDDALFELPEIARDRTLVCLSRLEAKKGIDVAIEAFHRAGMSPSVRQWQLVIAGDGSPSYVESLRRLAARGPAADRIEFSGWLDATKRLALLQRGGILLLPSHQENFGVALVEAMAAGMPALVGPGVNLAREIEDEQAGWVVDRSPEALAEALTRVCDADDERATRGRRARQMASRFRWSTVGASLEAMYARIVGARHGVRTSTDVARARPV